MHLTKGSEWLMTPPVGDYKPYKVTLIKVTGNDIVYRLPSGMQITTTKRLFLRYYSDASRGRVPIVTPTASTAKKGRIRHV